jgi:hypothetical protein
VNGVKYDYGLRLQHEVFSGYRHGECERWNGERTPRPAIWCDQVDLYIRRVAWNRDPPDMSDHNRSIKRVGSVLSIGNVKV